MVVPSQAAGVKIGRIDESEAVGIEVIADGLDDFVADADGGVLAPAAEPEMAMIHQEIDAVIFRRDGIRMISGDTLEHFAHLRRRVHTRLERAARRGFFRGRSTSIPGSGF